MNALALDSISVQASRILAMPVAGYLLAILGAWPIFAIRSLGCLLAVVWLLLARVPPTPPTARAQAPWQNLAEGFRYLRVNLVILCLVLLYVLPRLSEQSFTNFLPVFATNILKTGYYLQALLMTRHP